MIPLLNRGGMMKGFVQGADRQQTTLLRECLDDWVEESNPVRAVDVFVDALELRERKNPSPASASLIGPSFRPSAPDQVRRRLAPCGSGHVYPSADLHPPAHG